MGKTVLNILPLGTGLSTKNESHLPPGDIETLARVGQSLFGQKHFTFRKYGKTHQVTDFAVVQLFEICLAYLIDSVFHCQRPFLTNDIR